MFILDLAIFRVLYFYVGNVCILYNKLMNDDNDDGNNILYNRLLLVMVMMMVRILKRSHSLRLSPEVSRCAVWTPL